MGHLRAADALHCPRVGCEPGCYLCPFSRMRVTRLSVTGSRLAATSSVTGFRLGVAPSVSSCSRKDEDRSSDLARLPCCCLRKTLRTLILSPSTTKSMSPSSLSLSFRASLTEFFALCASVLRTESLVDFSTYSSQPLRGCRREWCWNSVTRSPAFREYPVRRRGQSADRWALWRASANHQPCAC